MLFGDVLNILPGNNNNNNKKKRRHKTFLVVILVSLGDRDYGCQVCGTF